MFRFDHVALAVTDLARSAAFYEHLGGRRVSLPSPNFVEVMLGDVRLHITRAGDGDPAEAAGIDHLCLMVEDLEDLIRVRDLINSHPVTGARGPFEIQESPPLDEHRSGHVEERVPRRTLYFEDPDGIRLEVRAYR